MIKKKAYELEFISQISRNGSGTEPIRESYLKSMLENPLMKDEDFELHCLSMSEKTYIAFNFNAFVVRIKETNQSKTNNNQNQTDSDGGS